MEHNTTNIRRSNLQIIVGGVVWDIDSRSLAKQLMKLFETAGDQFTIVYNSTENTTNAISIVRTLNQVMNSLSQD